MARRAFEMIDVVEILQHWHAGRPKSVVASSLGVDAKTVRKYVRPAEDAGMTPGGPPLGRDEWAALVAGWFPQLTDAKARSLTFSTIDAHRDRIAAMVKTNRPSTVYQRLRDEHGLAVSVTSFRRYLWSEFPDASDASRVTVPRPEVPAGEEAQVDYGFVGSWLDPVAERVRRVWAFIMVLAASRHMFVRPVLCMDQGAWVAAHVAAFSFFGGAPRRVVSDNLKTGVIKPDLYDPKLNRAYAELAAYYGVLIDPARASKPKDKPRVERMVPYVRDSMWRGRTWASEAEMRRAALVWCREVAGRPRAPIVGWRRAAGGLRRGRGRRAARVAHRAVRAGGLVDTEGGAGLPRQGRRGAVLGAVDAYRRPCGRAAGRAHRGDLRRRACQGVCVSNLEPDYLCNNINSPR
jgi:transposase